MDWNKVNMMHHNEICFYIVFFLIFAGKDDYAHRGKGGKMIRTILMIIGAIVVIGWIISIL